MKKILATAVAAVGLTAVADPDAVQLWEGGPYFATCDLGGELSPEESARCGLYFRWGETSGTSSPYVPSEDCPTYCPTYNKSIEALYNGGRGYIDANSEDGKLKPQYDAATVNWGAPWRMPTKAELDGLATKCRVYWVDNWEATGISGWEVCGNTDGYKDKCIFLTDAEYWSSIPSSDGPDAWIFDLVGVRYASRNEWRKIRPVRDTPLPPGPWVMINSAMAVSPWNSETGAIRVDYSPYRLTETVKYKVAFEVKAKGLTASVTNDVAKLYEDLWPKKTQIIETAKLFGKEVVDTKAKVKVSLIPVKPKKDFSCVQLWENGPYFARCNIGALAPEEYGYYFRWGDTEGAVRNCINSRWVSVKDGSASSWLFNEGVCPTCNKTIEQLYDNGNGYIDANSEYGKLKSQYDAATAHWGAPWRMPTKVELDKIADTAYCKRTWVTSYNGVSVSGYVVKGAKHPFTKNEVFFPAAGCVFSSYYSIGDGQLGGYWSSMPSLESEVYSWSLYFDRADTFQTGPDSRFYGYPVRPVRDSVE